MYAGWRFSFSGVIVNNISCLGVNDLKSSDFASLLFIPVGLGVGWIFSLCNFWIASSGDAAFCGVVCCGLSFCLGLGFSRPFCGEFDPGSGRTLAACLTHASRTERPLACKGYSSGERVSNTWVICLALWDKLGKLGLIPDMNCL